MTLPSFSLEGKTCIVTGAGRGLGKEFLAAFALSGARGACVDLSLQSGQSSIADIHDRVTAASPNYRPELRAYACDVTQESQVQDTFKEIVKDFGKVDVVLTAAGIVDNVAAEEYAYDRWRKMFDINLHGSFLWAREAGRYWIKEGIKGNLIFVSSMSAKICVRPQKQAAYNAVSLYCLHSGFEILIPGTVKGSSVLDGAEFVH
jgi:NAD(P)-dependent dehydrogenase (short-subunit alcohol dehydrogenase family)